MRFILSVAGSDHYKAVGGALGRGAGFRMLERQEPERAMEAIIDPQVLWQWHEEFAATARRPLEQRMRYAFIRTYKPVLDDAPFRAFDTMEEYRQWCEKNLPDWLGYGRV
jgi:hypothetical protein